VPISTQWDKKGYFYPTQISQFALSHWSKMVHSGPPEVLVLDDGGKTSVGEWTGDVTRVLADQNCAHFDSSSSISLALDSKTLTWLSFSLKVQDEGADVSVTIRVKPDLNYILKYSPVEEHVAKEGNVITFGYGQNRPENVWLHFSRDLLADLEKGLQGNKKAINLLRKSKPLISHLKLEGVGCVANVSMASERHFSAFLAAADWLVRNAEPESGGWPVGVAFNVNRNKYGKAEELGPGWHSAMSQGHAISVLSRAYGATMDRRYMDVALSALAIYTVPSEEGGFVAKFMDKLVWYEEYPTKPATFVLNGFMYSLLGLADLVDCLKAHQLQDIYMEEYKLASELLRQGLESLRKMLPLYDTGQGSFYDLRHFTMTSSQPKPARWDYHAAHVNLLYALSCLYEDEMERDALLVAAERWRAYMVGQRAKHN